MPAPTNGATKNLSDSRKQALILQALISSLAPNGSEGTKLSEEQAEALSDRLNQVLGNTDTDYGPEVRRNEKGEVLNEEGLPIIDITEPAGDGFGPSQSCEAFLSERDPPPLSSLSEQERFQLRTRRDRILDVLEEEECRDVAKDLEREKERRVEELAKVDAKSKVAAREMQKKMGKALLKNLAAQREMEDKERKKEQEALKASSQKTEANTKKRRKNVSFANVPDFDEEKPKPPVVWGGVSVAKLKTGLPKARLKADMLSKQPMKSDVVERTPGEKRNASQERDSDDESETEVYQHLTDESRTSAQNWTTVLNDRFEDSPEEEVTCEEDEFDFSQANIQREVALEYVRLREKVGAEARQAMISHTHDEEDEWDRPKVPLDASLVSKPSRGRVSRFKAERHAGLSSEDLNSVSLGASVLHQGISSTLQRAVRPGKLENGRLVGGELGESESEEGDNENVERIIEMLKNGTTIGGLPETPSRTADFTPEVAEREASGTSILPGSQTPNEKSAKSSRFKAERIARNQYSEPGLVTSENRVAVSSAILNAATKHSSQKDLAQSAPADAKSSVESAFKKPPSVIRVPSSRQSEHRTFVKPLIPSDPAVLSNMIVESPSFPPPNDHARTTPNSRPPPLVGGVREVTRRPGISEERTQQTAKVSRFMAQRL